MEIEKKSPRGGSLLARKDVDIIFSLAAMHVAANFGQGFQKRVFSTIKQSMQPIKAYLYTTLPSQRSPTLGQK